MYFILRKLFVWFWSCCLKIRRIIPYLNDFVLVFIKIYVSFLFEAERMSLQLIRISYKTSIVACVVKKDYKRLWMNDILTEWFDWFSCKLLYMLHPGGLPAFLFSFKLHSTGLIFRHMLVDWWLKRRI